MWLKTNDNKKGRELIGLQVLDLNSGKAVGEIKDILYSPMENRVAGFLVADNGWLWGAKILIYDQIKSIGSDAVVIDDIKKIHNTKHHPDYKRMYQDRLDIRGYELISQSGEVLGTIKDIVINPEGKITGYELSDGIVHDLLEGRKLISTPDNIKVSGEMVIFESIEE